MGINEPVLNIAFVSNDAACSIDLRDIMRDIAQRLVCIAPQDALREWNTSCEHVLIVVDGYALGSEALVVCRRLRLAGLTQPIVLAWLHSTDLDRAACREYGADEVISRPFVTGKVLSTILSAASDWQPKIGSLAEDRGRKHAGEDGFFGAGFAGLLAGSGGRAGLRTP